MATLLNVLKRRRISSFLSVMMLVFPVVLYIFADHETSSTAMNNTGEYVLVIDAGHGGIDSGAVASDGSKESDINLAIALKLRALAEFCGQSNFMIRQEDNTLSDGVKYSEHRDLEKRAEIVNDIANSVYISIHQNIFPTGQPSGSLVIYACDEESERLGKLIHSNLVLSLNPDNRRVAEPDKNDHYVLAHVSCPAILVECGFMSNFSEMEKLKTPEYQTSLATVIMASFLQYSVNSRYI